MIFDSNHPQDERQYIGFEYLQKHHKLWLITPPIKAGYLSSKFIAVKFPAVLAHCPTHYHLDGLNSVQSENKR